MKKLFHISLILIFTLTSGVAFSQSDTSKHLFKPGTLVGKYYGTYDTSAKKLPQTKAVAGISQSGIPETQLSNTGLSQQQELTGKKEVDLYEVSGTGQATGINTTDIGAERNNGASTTISGIQGLNKTTNIDPVEVSGTTEASGIDISTVGAQQSISGDKLSVGLPGQVQRNAITNLPAVRRVQSTPYRATRLGSSAPMYDTYRTNDNGAGSVTTNPNKGTGAGVAANESEVTIVPTVSSSAHNVYRDTRLGSSSPLYNTYRTNDNGAGSVTTNPNKGANLGVPVIEPVSQTSQATPAVQMNDTTHTVGSSRVYKTYPGNDNTTGAVTTNLNKAREDASVLPAVAADSHKMDSASIGKINVRKLPGND